MTTVGLNFTKITAERTSSAEHNIKVENNVGVTNVAESSIVDPKKSLVKFQFTFVCKYEPNIGTIEIVGELIEILDKEFATKVIESWTKNKSLHKDVTARVLNTILGKANIEAIVISRDLGLPSPIALPKVEIRDKAEPAPSKDFVRITANSEAKPDTKLDAKPKKK
jgi:hypothetical protein